MNKRRRVLLALGCTVVVAVVVVVLTYRQSSSPPDLATWDEGRLVRELEGLGYHFHAEPADRASRSPDGRFRLVHTGVYFCRNGRAEERR
jgi:hypothetical protein